MQHENIAQFTYYFGMIVATQVQAMGMVAENMQRQQLGQSMAYTDADFANLLEKNGVHHNALVEAMRDIGNH